MILFGIMPLSARDLQEQHGVSLAAPPLSACPSAYMLHKALHRLEPPMDLSYQAVRTWRQQYRSCGGVRIESEEDVELQHGERIRHISAEASTPYKL